MKRIEEYFRMMFGFIFVFHFTLGLAMDFAGHYKDFPWWDYHFCLPAGVIVGWLYTRFYIPVPIEPVYCSCPTCGSRVNEKRIKNNKQVDGPIV